MSTHVRSSIYQSYQNSIFGPAVETKVKPYLLKTWLQTGSEMKEHYGSSCRDGAATLQWPGAVSSAQSSVSTVGEHVYLAGFSKHRLYTPLPTPNYQTPAVATEQDHQQTIFSGFPHKCKTTIP